MTNIPTFQMEDEMQKFEAEIASQLAKTGAISGSEVAPSGPVFIPSQLGKHTKRVIGATYDVYAPPSVVVSAKPTIYATPKPAEKPPSQPTPEFLVIQSDIEKKLKKLRHDKMCAALANSQSRSSNSQQDGHKSGKKGSKNNKLVRVAGGTTWEDPTLADWPDDDFRIFCGDLGNDVTDELLFRTFNKYPSFQRAKVVRDKRTNKSKGYGFLSFKDPADFTRAIKEMNGRYVGSRPIKLRKSCWRNRCLDVVKKKEKEKAALLSMLTSPAAAAAATASSSIVHAVGR